MRKFDDFPDTSWIPKQITQVLENRHADTRGKWETVTAKLREAPSKPLSSRLRKLDMRRAFVN